MSVRQADKKLRRARNDIPCTTIDNLLFSHDLPTMTKQFIIYDNGSFERSRYLIDHIIPHGTI
ncbi:MAG: hypothetical protein QME45_14285 [Clostridiales bacterium]|nr:hypothetical protein [Clostridiales bacterium]